MDQQQLLPVLPHPRVGSLPVIMPLIKAEAQPTRAFTLSALKSQFLAHAPHSMHWSLPVITARLSYITNAAARANFNASIAASAFVHSVLERGYVREIFYDHKGIDDALRLSHL